MRRRDRPARHRPVSSLPGRGPRGEPSQPVPALWQGPAPASRHRPLRHLFSNLHRLRRHRAPPHRHQVPALPSPTRRRRCQANLRPLWPPGPDPRTHRLVRHLLAAQARASTAAALRRVRPADAAVEQRALQPLLATPPGPGRQPSREPRLCAERSAVVDRALRCLRVRAHGHRSGQRLGDPPRATAHRRRVTASTSGAGTSTHPGPLCRSARPDPGGLLHRASARIRARSAGPSRRRAPPTTRRRHPRAAPNWSRAVLRAPRRVPATSDPSLWVPIIRSWALTRGFALHPGTRNRYMMRYTRTQHRPA